MNLKIYNYYNNNEHETKMPTKYKEMNPAP